MKGNCWDICDTGTCELLALSTSQPTQLTFSLNTPTAAGNSALVRYLETQGPKTNLAMSHIRHATQGSVQLSNTQPFARELGGRTACFGHNGDLTGIERSKSLTLDAYRPVGQTDSELAFCALLSRLSVLWRTDDPPSLEARLSELASFAADLRTLGPANFLYADGDALFAHGHRRIQRALGRVEPPGLWMLQRHCPPVGQSPGRRGGVSITEGERVVVWFASVPLTYEAWLPLAEGELVAVRAGQVLATRVPIMT